MSDQITAKGSDAKYKSHPEGQFVGQCVDTIALGEKVQDFPGTVPYLAAVCAIVFRTGERNEATGDFIDIAKEYTVSMGPKANLRKDLEQWRGKPYTPEQIEAGVPLDKLTGNHALLSISHRTSQKGRTYANITACVGVPAAMKATAPTYADYKREAYWQERKKEYFDAATEFRNDTGAGAGEEDFSDFPGSETDDSFDPPF